MWLQKCIAIQRSCSALVISLEQILQEIDSQSLHFAAAKIPVEFSQLSARGGGKGMQNVLGRHCLQLEGGTAACSRLTALSLLCIPVQFGSGSQKSCLALWVEGSEARPCVVLLTGFVVRCSIVPLSGRHT